MLMKWIINHFTPTDEPRASSATAALMADTIVFTERMPIILQDGLHSRTVVGFEEVDSSTINLLVFDPSRYLFLSGQLSTLMPVFHKMASFKDPQRQFGPLRPDFAGRYQQRSTSRRAFLFPMAHTP